MTIIAIAAANAAQPMLPRDCTAWYFTPLPQESSSGLQIKNTK